MGATLSHFAYASHQQPDPRSHQHVSQLHQCLEPTLILGNENAASSTIIDLYTRLTALEKDLKISQLGNIEKEAVIQYLLQSSISNARVKESTTKLKEQLLLLKTTIDQKNKENKEIKDKLGKAEDTICALSRRSVLNSRSQSTSTSFSSRSDSPPKSEVVTEDLIDLSDCSQESDSAKLTEGDSTLLDDIYEDQLDVEDIKTDITPGQSSLESRDSLDSELQDFPYLVHFADSDGEDVSKEGDAHMTQIPSSTSDSVTPPPELGNDVEALVESAHYSPEDSSAPSRPESTVMSCGSLVSETTAPNSADTKLLNEGFSQLATLASERDEEGSLDRSVALVRMMAQSLPSLSTYEPAKFSVPALKKPQKMLEKVDISLIEPQWSISKTFDSSQERESAVSFNRRIGGPNELRYPDLFKYGIHYSPSDSERDVYRTVVVSNISPDINLGTLLQHVRGGMVIDAKLLDTVKITGKKSALITFLHEHAAMSFEDYAEENPVVINGVLACVRVVSTPTWPIRIPLRKAIMDHHHTRCLMVYNYPWHISSQKLRNDLTVLEMNTDRLTYMEKRKDGVLELQFSSVDWAGHAFGMLGSYRAYSGCTACFAQDPCARPLENLEGPVNPFPAEVETVIENTTAPDAESATVDQPGRLAKVEWDCDPEVRRGRGFLTGP